jgi:hypothetical protein
MTNFQIPMAVRACRAWHCDRIGGTVSPLQRFPVAAGEGGRVSPPGEDKQVSFGADNPARGNIHGPLRDTDPRRARSFSETPICTR